MIPSPIPSLPREGDTVLFCAHADVGTDHIYLPSASFHPAHWFVFEVEATDTRTGEFFESRWTVLCSDCNSKCDGKVLDESLIRKHARWIGDPPRVFPDAERN